MGISEFIATNILWVMGAGIFAVILVLALLRPTIGTLDLFFGESGSQSGFLWSGIQALRGLIASGLHAMGATRRFADKWVAGNLKAAREHFENLQFVRENEHIGFVPCPVWLQDKDAGDFGRLLLRAQFNSSTVPVIIAGPAGAGKSSAAVQACRWALDAEESCRLFAERAVIPVLMSAREFRPETMLRDLGACIDELTSTATELPPWAVRLLLRQGRLLLVIDDLSEVTEANSREIARSWREIGGRYLLLTSRRKPEGFREVRSVELREYPADRFEQFIGSYLELRDVSGYVTSDAANLGRHYRRITGEHASTGFLLKLCCDQYLQGGERTAEVSLRRLMQAYIERINRHARAAEEPDNEALWAACGRLATEIVAANDWGAGTIAIAKARVCLGEKVPLNYLTDKLRIVVEERGRVYFSSKTVLFALAALNAADSLGSRDDQWSARIAELRNALPKSQSFASILYWSVVTDTSSPSTANLRVLRELADSGADEGQDNTPDGLYAVARCLSGVPVIAPSGVSYSMYELLPHDQRGIRVHGKRYDLESGSHQQICDLETKAHRHAEVCQALESRYLQKCLGTCRDDKSGSFWVYERWIDGDTLSVRQREHSVQDEHGRIMKAVARGIADFHKAGKVIRALNPDSVLLSEWSNEPTLTNFEMTKTYSMKSVSAGANFTRPPYVAPEVRDDSSLVDSSRQEAQLADVYSWGAIYYFLLTGKDPIQTDSAGIRAALHLTAASATTIDLIVKCMSETRSSRPPSIKAVLDRL